MGFYSPRQYKKIRVLNYFVYLFKIKTKMKTVVTIAMIDRTKGGDTLSRNSMLCTLEYDGF